MFDQTAEQRVGSLGNLGGRLQIGFGKEVVQLIYFKFSRLLVNLVNSLQAKTLTAIAIFVDLIDKFVIARFNDNGQRFVHPIGTVGIDLGASFLVVGWRVGNVGIKRYVWTVALEAEIDPLNGSEFFWYVIANLQNTGALITIK